MIRRCPNKFMRAQLRRLRDDHALIDDADRDVSEAILRAKRSGNSTMLRHEPLDVVALVPPAWLADERRPTNVGQGQRVRGMGHVLMKETMCLTKPARQRFGTLTIREGGHANFHAHLGIAKDRHAETSPYGLMVRHSPPELTTHFGSRRQNRTVRFWHMV